MNTPPKIIVWPLCFSGVVFCFATGDFIFLSWYRFLIDSRVDNTYNDGLDLVGCGGQPR